jgi:hypothetical protein
MYERRPHVPQNVLDSYDRVMAWLMDVQRGRAQVPEFTIDANSNITGKFTTVINTTGLVDRSGMIFNDSNI